MDLRTALVALLPEFLLLAGGSAALLAGVGRSRGEGKLPGYIAIASVVLALLAALRIGTPEAVVPAPGLLLTPLVQFVRLAGLAVGLLLLLVNLSVPEGPERPEFFSLVVYALLGLLLTAAANDLLVLFFAIELVSVPTYVLVALSRRDKRASEAAVKYFFLGSMASAIMVYGFSFLYGTLGGHTLIQPVSGQEALASVAATLPRRDTLVIAGLLFSMAGVLFKMAAAPLHFYVADVYEGAASPVTGVLGFLPKFAGLLAGVKLLAIFNWELPPQVFWTLWLVAAATMTLGNTLALFQQNVKRMLAYSSVAHSGYILIGLLVGPALVAGAGPMRDGVAAALFYIIVYGTMNLGAFAVLAALERRGEAAETLTDIEGLSHKHPGLALILAICVFSLMGFPPTAGLLGKVYIFSSAFFAGEGHTYAKPLLVLAVFGAVNTAIGAAYYLRIVAACYNRPAGEATRIAGRRTVYWGAALCSLVVLALFIRPGFIAAPAHKAAAALQAAQPPHAPATRLASSKSQ
jgi:NADH-quinone oxidoreductase subunit N